MLKANKKTLIITSFVILLPMLIGIIFWRHLPDVMATHFGMNNEADGYSSKAFAIFGLPAFLLVIHWFCAFVTACDPKKQNISPKMYALVLWIVPVISLIVAAVEYPVNLGYQIDISFYMELVIGVLFVIIGNYLPKARQNYTIGIRIPWTLANEENWNRTHRIGGYLWVIGGMLMVILGLTRAASVVWMIIIFLAMALVPCVYSYWLHANKGL